MIVAIFISQDKLGFASVTKNPKMLVALPSKCLFLIHSACLTWVGQEGCWEMGRLCFAFLFLVQYDKEGYCLKHGWSPRQKGRTLWMASQLNGGPRSDASHFPSLTRTNFIGHTHSQSGQEVHFYKVETLVNKTSISLSFLPWLVVVKLTQIIFRTRTEHLVEAH